MCLGEAAEAADRLQSFFAQDFAHGVVGEAERLADLPVGGVNQAHRHPSHEARDSGRIRMITEPLPLHC